MRFNKLLEGAGVLESRGALDVPVRAVRDDSRSVQPGDVFVAVRGTKVDGHTHIAQALAAGAAALVCETPPECAVPWARVSSTRAALAALAANACGRPAERLRFFGITGTNGKTTTAWLTEALLRGTGHRVALLGTVSNRIEGVARPASLTTPAPLELHAFFADALAAGCTDVVMEVSSHALDQQRVQGLRFHAAGFTNLTQDHLDLHGSMEAYGAAKALLFSAHLADNGTAVINLDGEGAARMQAATRAACLSVSARDPFADLHAEVHQSGLEGQTLALRRGRESAVLRTPLVGRHNAENLLVAIGLGLCAGLSLTDCAAALRGVNGVPGRLERVRLASGVAAFVDYAHTPDALQRMLTLLRTAQPRRLIVVFGCGGDRDAGKRPLMGRIAADLADEVILTSDNPRSEDPRRILEQILGGVPQDLRAKVRVEPDRRAALRAAVACTRAGDALLVAGKGHEDHQIIGSLRTHFDDREELLAAGGAA